MALPFRQHLEESVRTFFFKVRHFAMQLQLFAVGAVCYALRSDLASKRLASKWRILRLLSEPIAQRKVKAELFIGCESSAVSNGSPERV